jgi:hypothetical protein
MMSEHAEKLKVHIWTFIYTYFFIHRDFYMNQRTMMESCKTDKDYNRLKI